MGFENIFYGSLDSSWALSSGLGGIFCISDWSEADQRLRQSVKDQPKPPLLLSLMEFPCLCQVYRGFLPSLRTLKFSFQSWGNSWAHQPLQAPQCLWHTKLWPLPCLDRGAGVAAGLLMLAEEKENAFLTGLLSLCSCTWVAQHSHCPFSRPRQGHRDSGLSTQLTFPWTAIALL